MWYTRFELVTASPPPDQRAEPELTRPRDLWRLEVEYREGTWGTATSRLFLWGPGLP